NEHAEGAAKMVRMGQGLELFGAGWRPGLESAWLGLGLRQNLREEFALPHQPFRGQPGGPARRFDGGKIDVRRDVALAGIVEQAAATVMPGISPQRSAASFGAKLFLVGQTVVDCQ